MNLKIDRLLIENFKGIKQTEICFGSEDARIYGANATGKTSIFDAFLWLLFGKDSTGRSDFGVKPYDSDGNEIHNLETVVEAAMLSDETGTFTLRHLMQGNWVKKNGQSDRVYSGNQHKYWINGVSKSSSEYESFIGKIISKDLFILLTNPAAFNAMKWQDRREVLVKLSPVDIDSLLLMKPEYQVLKAELAYRATDLAGLKKVKKEQKARDDKELDQIPVKVAELERLIVPDIENACVAAREKKSELESQLAALTNNDDSRYNDGIQHQIAVVLTIASDLERQKQRIITERKNEHLKAEMKASKDLGAVQLRLSIARSNLEQFKTTKENAERSIADLEGRLASARQDWYRVSDEKFVQPEISGECPYCKQPLPDSMVQEAISKAMADFKSVQNKRLDEIDKAGRQISEEITCRKGRISDLDKSIAELSATIEADEKTEATCKAACELFGEAPDFCEGDDIAQLQKKIDETNAEAEALKAQLKPKDEKNTDALAADLKKSIAEQDEIIAQRTMQESLKKRIAELCARQDELGSQIAETEQFLMLIDSYTTERCKALEETINKLFPTVRWKLFDVQINSGIKDTCVCLINGVPYSDANNAAKINAGLEIIGVLSSHYGVSVPVFTDNAEAVNELMKIDSQQIALVVSDDKAIRTEFHEKELEVA